MVFKLSNDHRLTIHETWTVAVTDPKHLAYSNLSVDVNRFCHMLVNTCFRHSLFANGVDLFAGLNNHLIEEVNDAGYAVRPLVDLPEKIRNMVNETFVKYVLTCAMLIVVKMHATTSPSTPRSKSRNCSVNLTHAQDVITKIYMTVQQQRQNLYGHVQRRRKQQQQLQKYQTG